MTDLGTASAKQLTLPLDPRPEDEAGVGERRRDTPVGFPQLLERALEWSNMQRPLRDNISETLSTPEINVEWRGWGG